MNKLHDIGRTSLTALRINSLEHYIIPGDFEDESLKYLYMSTRLGTMRAAADALGVSPSSVSRQISHLEKKLGVQLVEKRSHKMRLSEAGQYVFEYYKERLVHKEVLITNLDDLKGIRTGHYTLAVSEGFISSILFSTLARYIEEYPGVQLDIITASTQDIISMICEDLAHVGFIFDTFPDPRVRIKFVIEQTHKAIVSNSHPLASRKSINLRDLVEFPLILPKQEFYIRGALRAVEQAENIKLRPSIATNSLLLTRELVKCTLGVSIISDLSIIDELDSGNLIALSINDEALMGAKVDVITRLGRVLPSGAQAILNILEMEMSAQKN